MTLGTLAAVTQEDAQLPLHEILALEEGRQTEALSRFYDMNDTVLLKTSSGSPLKVSMGGRELTVSNRGVRVSPRLAVQILRGWGYRGKYWARDRATGLRQIDLAHLPEETKKRIQWYVKDIDFDNFNPREDYVIHVPSEDSMDEIERLEAEFKALEAKYENQSELIGPEITKET